MPVQHTATPEHYRQIFEQDARGRAILADLARRFILPSVTVGGIDAVLQTAERGGMAKVLTFIDQQIDNANGGADRQSTFDIQQEHNQP